MTRTSVSLPLLILYLFSMRAAAQGEGFQYTTGSVNCVTDPVTFPGITISAIGCGNFTGESGTALGFGNVASGFATMALGQLTTASGNIAVAMGFNTTAGSNSSFVAGVNSRTISDPLVPGGSSGGGAISMGIDCASTGDWALSVGSGSEAVGYASAAIGEHAVAHTWGEVSLGLYTEVPELSLEEQRSQAVIPTFREEDVALRVGIGCSKKEHIGGIGCEEERRHDALRVYKSGRLYLKKLDGSVIEDVGDEISKLMAEVKALKEELAGMKEGSGGGTAGGSRRLSESTTSVDALFYMFIGGAIVGLTSVTFG